VDRAEPAQLVGPAGERIELPAEVFTVLREVVLAMAEGEAVTVAPHHQTLTTQEAADLLGVSRPTLVRLLEQGKIPYEQPGPYRRVLLRDFLAYQDHRRGEREAALDEMIEVSEGADAYARAAKPRRTRCVVAFSALLVTCVLYPAYLRDTACWGLLLRACTGRCGRAASSRSFAVPP